MRVMYLDESGDHSLDKIDPSYPVFVLGGVIMDRHYARAVVEPALGRLKQRFFGNADIPLHTTDIVRARNGFETLADPGVRSEFYKQLNDVMRFLDYTVVACVIRKDRYRARFGPEATDPYLLSLNVLVEQFCAEIGDEADAGLICAEKRGSQLDSALESAWVELLRNGTRHLTGGQIDRCIVDLSLKDKRVPVAGLQLADLVVSPIGRAVTGKAPRQDWEVVRSKLGGSSEGSAGFRLVVLPEQE